MSLDLFGYIAASLMGLSLGMIGAGGSILIVPILVYLFHHDPLWATTESLLIVGLTAFGGSLAYLKNKELNLKAATSFILPSFVGVFFVRKIVLPNTPDILFYIGTWPLTKATLIMLVFSILMILASFSMIRGQKGLLPHSKNSWIKTFFINATIGFLVGGITTFIGAGGGFLIIPSLVILLGLPMRQAVGTSLVIISCNALFGFWSSESSVSSSQWNQMLIITLIALGGLGIGKIFSKAVPEAQLKKSFGYFVLIVGSLILFDQLWK